MATIHRIIDTTDLAQQQGSTSVDQESGGRIDVSRENPVAFDLSSSFESTGRFVLVDEYDIAGGGIVTELAMTNRNSCAKKRVSVILPG